MQLFVLLTFIIGVCYAAPSDILDGNNDKFNPIGEASSLNSDVQPAEQPEPPKYGCSIFDGTLSKNCSEETEMYLDESRKTCCTQIVNNNCKIRLLKQACSEEEYIRKVNTMEQMSNLVWNETPDCPKNYDKSYCDVSIGESLVGLPPSWVFTGAIVFLVVIFLLAIIFGIKYC